MLGLIFYIIFLISIINYELTRYLIPSLKGKLKNIIAGTIPLIIQFTIGLVTILKFKDYTESLEGNITFWLTIVFQIWFSRIDEK